MLNLASIEFVTFYHAQNAKISSREYFLSSMIGQACLPLVQNCTTPRHNAIKDSMVDNDKRIVVGVLSVLSSYLAFVVSSDFPSLCFG
mgnify:CR=1 FL=1